MKLNRTHSILLFTAIFHLLADVAFAGGSVLCVGPNDHAEIEVGHVSRNCGPFQDANVQESDPASAIGDGSDCIDTPLHAEAEMVAEDHSWDANPPPAAVLFSYGSRSLHERGSDLFIGQGTDLTPTMRAHRSIVLTI